MKRLHLHIAVEDLEQSIQFYSAMFGTAPSKQKSDYAKWMLEDPQINFAISSRGGKIGVEHLGIQVDSKKELSELREQMKAADFSLFDEDKTTCCYVASDKSWVKNPSGIPWETYHTMVDVEFFSAQESSEKSSCCLTSMSQMEESTNCCTPKNGCC